MKRILLFLMLWAGHAIGMNAKVMPAGLNGSKRTFKARKVMMQPSKQTGRLQVLRPPLTLDDYCGILAGHVQMQNCDGSMYALNAIYELWCTWDTVLDEGDAKMAVCTDLFKKLMSQPLIDLVNYQFQKGDYGHYGLIGIFGKVMACMACKGFEQCYDWGKICLRVASDRNAVFKKDLNYWYPEPVLLQVQEIQNRPCSESVRREAQKAIVALSEWGNQHEDDWWKHYPELLTTVSKKPSDPVRHCGERVKDAL